MVATAVTPRTESVVTRGGRHRVAVRGRLDRPTAHRLGELVMTECRRHAAEPVVVDLSQVASVDRAGLRALVACRRRAAGLGVDLVLHQPAEVLMDALTRTGLDRAFAVEPATPAPTLGAAGPNSRAGSRRS